MEQAIGKYSFWLGIVFAALAFLLRAMHALDIYVGNFLGRAINVAPSNLVEGAVLLLLVSIASAHYASYIKKA